MYLYIFAYICTHNLYIYVCVTESGFAKLEAKILSLAGGIIFSETELSAEISPGFCYIQKTAIRAYVISLLPVPLILHPWKCFFSL